MQKNYLFHSLRPFLILWSTQAVSALGTAMTNYALVVWIYRSNGTASSVAALTLCSFLPTILFRFLAGAIADRMDKKCIMLVCDLAAACGSAITLGLLVLSRLAIWHLYVIQFLLSFMNAFQVPAAYVATSLLVPREAYAKTEGLQSASNAIISILAPVLGSMVFAFGGLELVLTLDLFSFGIAFFPLLLLIRIPKSESEIQEKKEPFLQACLSGVGYLRKQPVLLRLILFFTLINFLAKIGENGMVSVLVLAKSGGNQSVLGMAQSCMAIGLLFGSLLAAWSKPPKRPLSSIYFTCGLLFLGNLTLSLSNLPLVWCLSAFFAYSLAAWMNILLGAFMRTHVPLSLQGRVFSARDTLQNIFIPLGIFLGGLLADGVFDPIMTGTSGLVRALSRVFGGSEGAGISLQFFLVGLLGSGISFFFWFRSLHQESPPEE
ncbi:MAG: MFS transporter [Clostridia bacterium]|nr:MFS transporter [Clostridia bacterium]